MKLEKVVKKTLDELIMKRNNIIESGYSLLKTFGDYAYVNQEEKNKMKEIINKHFDELCELNEKIKLLNDIKSETNE